MSIFIDVFPYSANWYVSVLPRKRPVRCVEEHNHLSGLKFSTDRNHGMAIVANALPKKQCCAARHESLCYRVIV
ncbi:MAG: hypothetical protein AAGA72_17520 [Pseudomonadota bacterium]